MDSKLMSFNEGAEEGSSGICVKVGFASPKAEIFCISKNLHEVLLSHAVGKAKPKPGKPFSSNAGALPCSSKKAKAPCQHPIKRNTKAKARHSSIDQKETAAR